MVLNLIKKSYFRHLYYVCKKVTLKAWSYKFSLIFIKFEFLPKAMWLYFYQKPKFWGGATPEFTYNPLLSNLSQ